MVEFIKISKKLMISCAVMLMMLLFILLVIYLVSYSNANHSNLRASKDVLAMRMKMPSFDLPTVNSANQEQQTVNERVLRHKVTLLFVWSSRCRYYQQEHKFLLNMAKKLNKQKINVIGLNMFDSREQASAWLKVHGDPYKFSLFDQSGALVTDLGISSVPDLFIVDSYGYIQYRYSGVLNKEIWVKKIGPLLKIMCLS